MSLELLAQGAPPGHYIAIWKLIFYLVFFVFWAWVGQWMDTDTQKTRANRLLWNGLYAGIGSGTFFLWLILPSPFIFGLLLFLVAWLILTVTYVLHRNDKVPEVDQILTREHLRFFLLRKGNPKEVSLRTVIYSSHGNALPVPHKQDPEFSGYVLAEELIYEVTHRRVSVARGIPQSENMVFQYTIDGVRSNAGEHPRQEADQGLAYLKAVSGIDVNERRRPQVGLFSVDVEGDRTEWILKTAGSTRGEQVALERIVAFKTMTLDSLGFHPDQLERLKEIIGATEGGNLLVTGPVGSGVTSTLYSMIRHHDGYTMNLHSLEKEFLCDLDNVTQHSVEEESKETSDARCLRSVLLGDPDVVMVGSCEDPKLPQVAIEAASNGKKIYFGMNTPSTFHALEQWLKWANNNRKVVATLKLITNQRLLRMLCTECRQSYRPDPNLLKKLNLPADKIKQFYRPPSEVEYDKQGNPILCGHCQGTGYYGRTAVFETLELSETVRQMIQDDKPINVIRAQCRSEKMLYLQEQAIRKVIEGVTSIQEVMRVTTKAKLPKPQAPPKEAS